MTWSRLSLGSSRCKSQATDSILRLGFLQSIFLTLRLKEGALLSGGPPCGSFIFLNRATSGRSKRRPLGNTRRPYVKDANKNLDITFNFPSLQVDFLKCIYIYIYTYGNYKSGVSMQGPYIKSHIYIYCIHSIYRGIYRFINFIHVKLILSTNTLI